jgi:hypothetical protein
LARAVRHESVVAIQHWWGVCNGVVHRWRRALGVGRMDNPGSRRLILAASAKGADVTRGAPLPPEQVERRCRGLVSGWWSLRAVPRKRVSTSGPMALTLAGWRG